MKATIFAIAVAGLAAANDEAAPAYDASQPSVSLGEPKVFTATPSVSLGEPKVFTATPSVSLGEPLTFTATPTVALGPPKSFTKSAPAASSTASSCPAPGEKDASGRYSCNPAHSYPNGQYCTLLDGCYFLRTVGPDMPAPTSVPVSYETKTVSEFTTVCPSPTTFVHSATTYAVTAATTIVIPCPGGCAVTKPVTTASTSVPVSYETKTVSEFTTFCPSPTTFVHSATTYAVTAATTMVIPCPGGCAVTKPVTAPGTTPAPQPTLSTAVPSVPVSRNGTTSAPPAAYTGAAHKMLAGGAPLAAAALGAFFL